MLKKERFIPRSGTRYFEGERNGNALHFSMALESKGKKRSFWPFLVRSISQKNPKSLGFTCPLLKPLSKGINKRLSKTKKSKGNEKLSKIRKSKGNGKLYKNFGNVSTTGFFRLEFSLPKVFVSKK